MSDELVAVMISAMIGILFIILGIVFSLGKGANLIAGYNTASKREKDQYDKSALCRFVGKLMFAVAGCWAIYVIGLFCASEKLIAFGIMLLLIVVVVGIIYANTGNRFKKKR